MEKIEKEIKPISAYGMIGLATALIFIGFTMLSAFSSGFSALFFIAAVFVIKGFFFINPNRSRVMTLFGKYIGTVKTNGFFWINPFYLRKNVKMTLNVNLIFIQEPLYRNRFGSLY